MSNDMININPYLPIPLFDPALDYAITNNGVY